jgi:predicted Fe-Mo cluster-binding NifX family protein
MGEKIIFAFAVTHHNNFGNKHFGDADKYLIYEFTQKEVIFVEEILNLTKNIDEKAKPEHGSQKKGKAVIKFMKERGVKVLVAKKFGENIKMVNKRFIPVIIAKENPDDVSAILLKHLKWFKDELINKLEEYKLFIIKNGILKTAIKKD